MGSHLCERLRDQGHTITSLDNYFTGSKYNHIENVEYIFGSTKNIREILSNRKFTRVYHLGEYSRVEQSFDDIRLVWESNKTGTFEVLEFCRQTGAKLIYSGSSTKFSDTTLGYIQSPYAWTKASNTELVKNYGLWYGLDYAITYFYNVFGKREISTGKYATLIGLFTEKMKNCDPLTIVAPGDQKRNFTHVDDIVDALVLIGEKGSGDEYGIGNPKEYTILDLAKLFGGKIEMIDARRGNRMSAKVLTEKTRTLGWSAKRNLSDYIETLRKNGWKHE